MENDGRVLAGSARPLMTTDVMLPRVATPRAPCVHAADCAGPRFMEHYNGTCDASTRRCACPAGWGGARCDRRLTCYAMDSSTASWSNGTCALRLSEEATHVVCRCTGAVGALDTIVMERSLPPFMPVPILYVRSERRFRYLRDYLRPTLVWEHGKLVMLMLLVVDGLWLLGLVLTRWCSNETYVKRVSELAPCAG